MTPLPTQDLRGNLATWAVPTAQLPAVARALLDALPPEPFDPGFRGQAIATTYFDTSGFALRKARRKGKRYLTLRVRCYPDEVYALSAKTEDRKFRLPLDPGLAEDLLDGNTVNSRLADLLPGDLLARLQDLAGREPLRPVVTVRATRYACEDDADRLTLDCGVATDTGKCLPTCVLEFKSTLAGRAPPPSLAALGLRPIKLSKFLWSTLWR
jgi:hypothetical protein